MAEDVSRMEFGTLSFSYAETLRHEMARWLETGGWWQVATGGGGWDSGL